MPQPNATPEQLFWKKVARTTNHNECWNWTGTTHKTGYGQISINNKKHYAHRYSYQINKGQIPDGYFICHTCDNPTCVNPNHLYAGTHKTNMRDMVNKQRHRDHNKTHCKRGHELTPDNCYTTRGTRDCKTCAKQRSRYNYYRSDKSNQNDIG